MRAARSTPRYSPPTNGRRSGCARTSSNGATSTSGGSAREQGMDRTLRELRDAFLAELEATRARSTYRRMKDEVDAAIAFLGSVRVRDLTPAAVMEWRRKRMLPKPPKRPGGKERKGVSVRTANMGGAALRACLEWARTAGLIAANPLRDLKPLANPE